MSEAYQQAAAIARVDRIMLFCYELWHESLAAPIRFVDDKAPLEATLEDDAPRNAAEVVTFVACPLSMQRPEENDGTATPKISLARPDVGGLLKSALDAARATGSLEPWTVIERVYASDDTSRLARSPALVYELSEASIAGVAASISAQYDDDGNFAIPRTTFKRSAYPGLQR